MCSPHYVIQRVTLVKIVTLFWFSKQLQLVIAALKEDEN